MSKLIALQSLRFCCLSCLILTSCVTQKHIPKASQPTAVIATQQPGTSADSQTINEDITSPLVQRSDIPEERDRLVYYQGKQGSISNHQTNNNNLNGKKISLNFIDAPVREVTRAIINDVFSQTLSVADDVEGIITLISPEPVPAQTALNTLERALSESGLTLIKNPNGYLLTSFQVATNGTNRVSSNQGGPIGYSATIVPVKHTLPSEIVRLIEPFASNRLMLRPDDAQSLIVIQGTQTDAQEAINAVHTFDAPFLTDRVFGMFDIRYSDALTIKAEIESVMGLSRPQNSRSVEMIALPRLNRLFVAARDDGYFEDARGWIDRLDRAAGGDERRLRYYVAQNTPASTLASQLGSVFGISGLSIDSSSNESGDGRALNPQPASFQSSGNQVSIVPDELNNALIVRATDAEYREILTLVQKMDVLAPQVLIEATIAEVTLTDDLSYGVRWSYENAESTSILSDSNAIGAVFPGFSYTFIDSDVRAALNALASVTDVTVLSAPSIMVQNNQSANLQVGDEVPIVTQTASSVIDGDAPIVSTIQLRDTGVILEVKPRINASDVVVLDVTQEVSDVVPTTTSGIDSPTIQQRRFTSTVAVRNNGTVALGGLIRETQTDNESGIPVLKDIPGIGNAFKSRDTNTRRTELMIFLTPKIIRDDATAEEALDHLRSKMDNLHSRFDGISAITK